MANFNFNKVILGGRLTADPELKQTTGGKPVTAFSVAVNRRFAKPGEQRATDFINCVAWGTNAEFISRYFRKGSCICIVGNLQVRTWNDQNGQKRYTTEVIVDEANFVDSASESKGSSDNGYNPYAEQSPAFSSNKDEAPKFEQMIDDDDLPF